MAIESDCKVLLPLSFFSRFLSAVSMAILLTTPVVADELDIASDILADSLESTVSLRDALFDELAQDAERYQKQYGIVKRVVRLVSPTIVHIDAYAAPVSTRGRETKHTSIEEAGSGIIIELDEQFYVLTNRHVIDRANLESITIRTDKGDRLTPARLWADPSTDVAVIGMAASQQLLPARIGNSREVEIGDFVLAVGSPFGLSHSVSYGIVSAKGRWDLELGQGDGIVRFQDFLQTDAAINPGNSGGPLLNLRGEVIGINTAIASNSGGNEGIGFSIPIHLALNVAKQLIEQGSVSTAYLGVRLDHDFVQKMVDDQTVANELGLSRIGGAFVKSVTQGSPAAEARIRNGDVILEFDGTRVEDDDHLINLVSLTPLNQVVTVMIMRARRPYLVHVRLGKRRDFERVDQARK